MNEGKIVFKGKSKKGNEIVIRYIQKGDAELMWEYINTLSKEKTYIMFQGKKISLTEERKYLKEQLRKLRNKETVQLLAFCKHKLIGVSDVIMGDEKTSMPHIGIFGLTIAKDFRGEGIGKILMENVIQEAINNISKLKMLKLTVFDNNHVAKKLYKQSGFMEYGLLPDGLLSKGEYIDEVFMYKIIKGNII